MKKNILNLVVISLFSTSVFAKELFTYSSNFAEQSILGENNIEGLPAANASWEQFYFYHKDNIQFVDKNSKKLVDEASKIYSIDTKAVLGDIYTQYERRLLSCGRSPYLINNITYILKKVDKQGSIMSLQNNDIKNALIGMEKINPNHEALLKLHSITCS